MTTTMNNKLFLLVGKSASGKSTIATILEKVHGYKQVESYTTRKPRHFAESGHVFVSEEDFLNLGELTAYTFYNGNKYGVTYEQLEQCSTYVIDVPGVENLLKNLNGSRPICIVYFDAAVSTRIMRMIERGACDHEIIGRLLTDDTTNDWFRELDKLVWHYKNIEHQDVELHKIDANENIENVLKQILYYIGKNEETE